MNEEDFYSRQIFLKEIGLQGQNHLRRSRVLIVGAGGLGHPLGSYLAAAGVGEITILDFDTIEKSNLNRQVCFTPNDIGSNKCDVLKNRLKAQNPFIKVNSLFLKISTDNAEDIISDYDIIVDCCDNFSTKFLLHDCCWFLDKALVQASVYQYEGQLQIFDFRKHKESLPCLRCLWPSTPDNKCVQNCQQSGILGPVVGALGSLQAMEVIKLITNIGTPQSKGTTYTLNLLDLDIQRNKWSKSNECPLCSSSKRINSIEFSNYHQLDEYEVLSVKEFEGEVLDIRETSESIQSCSSYLLRPMTEYSLWKEELDFSKSYLLVCSTGKRSLDLANKLNELGYSCYSLYGGLNK